MPGLLVELHGIGSQRLLMTFMRIKNEPETIIQICLLFLGLIDIFYIARFVFLNISQERIPLIDDIISFGNIYPQQGEYSLILFSLSLLLNISVVCSVVLLFIKWKSVHWIIYAQTPLRLIFVVPSLSVLPWLLKNISISTGLILFVLTLVSEVLKISSFFIARKNSKAQ